jgi:polysaccharide export outer membrane protein
MRLVYSFLILALFLAPAFAADSPAGQASAAPQTAPSQPAPPALRIAAGDLLDMEVFDTPELSAKLRVSDQGEVVLPVAGSVHVVGLTAEEAAVHLERVLRDNKILKEPHVTVFITEYATQGVSVLGEVKTPGVYPLLGAHGLLDIISAAGGATATAGKAVSVTHKADPQHPVVVQLDSAPDMAARANVALQPGDTVVVSRSGIVYVVGDLTRPGGFLIENNDRLTLLQAIALAGGTNRTAALDRSKIVRKAADGHQELPVELKKIFAGKRPDIRLEDGDILFVPSSEAKNIAYRGIEATISMATGVVIYSSYR